MPFRIAMSELAALAAFSFISAATPGPNNVTLWASGIEFGLRRSLPHVLGTSLGIGTMAVATAGGLGALIAAAPQLELAMKLIGSFYLLYLAYRIAGSRVAERSDLARPLRLGQAAAFQYVNPKAWVFVLAALTTFRPSGMPVMAGSGAMALTMMVVVLPSALLWVTGGTVLGRFISGGRNRRVVSVSLAVLLVATVAYIWV
jgi:threonine/homoserine/homoserine lactone efflux protein